MDRRAVLIVIDGLGVGALPDAREYGDLSADTLSHIAERVPLRIPNLARMGLARLVHLPDAPKSEPTAAYGKMGEFSCGKDSVIGHWEMMGIISDSGFPLYPNGFPPDVIEPFERAIGRKVLGNCPASGTKIIEELGGEHMESGRPIIYTSADSVFQIAAHEEIVPVEELYRWSKIARRILKEPHRVGRVIARPFGGAPGNFFRTERRRDFPVDPPEGTLLDRLAEEHLPTVAIGKVSDLFAGHGISQAIPTADDRGGMEQTIKAITEINSGLIFTNLVDFDTKYGHRNDVTGCARALEEIDRWIPEALARLKREDLLIFAADHGNDPTGPGTDHTREYVPLIAAGPSVRPVSLGTRKTFADVGKTLAEYFGIRGVWAGTSFLRDLGG